MTSTYPVDPNSPSDPPFVLTLPAGWVQIIKKIDATSNTVTLVSANNNNPPFASLGQTFDGASTFVLAKQNDFVMLQSDGANWRVIGGSHSTLTARTTSTTVVSTRTTYDATTAPIVATLPAAAAVQAGANYIIKKIDASVNAVTVTPAGSDLIDGQTSYALSAQYKYVSLFSDGVSNWYIDGNN
jgi:Cu/Ag efflux protein CusF